MGMEEEQQKLNEVCQLLKRKPLQLYSLTSYDHVRRQLGDTIEQITDEMIQMRRRMHIAQTTPFPIVENRPTSSQLSITSTKAAQKDDKKKKKSKTEVKLKGKEKNEDDNRTSSTQLSNYSDAETGANLNDPENALLRENYIIKMKSITKEILISSFDQIASLLSND